MRIAFQIVIAALLAVLGFAQGPVAVVPSSDFRFGNVIQGAVVDHTFVIRNDGAATLEINTVSMSPPIQLAGVRSRIPPGEEGFVKVRLDTGQLSGEYDGRVLVTSSDATLREADLHLIGIITPRLELRPSKALFIIARRGQRASKTVELVNHEPEPISIVGLEFPRDRLSATTDTLEPGKRFRVTVALNPATTSGRQRDEVLIRTSSKTHPTVRLTAFTYLHERVYTFPDAVDIGVLRLRQVIDDPTLLQKAAQILMVYQLGGSDFKVNVRTNVPGLDLKTERGPNGDRFQITAVLRRDAVVPKKIEGNILIETNDPEFPTLTVPVTGEIIR